VCAAPLWPSLAPSGESTAASPASPPAAALPAPHAAAPLAATLTALTTLTAAAAAAVAGPPTTAPTITIITAAFGRIQNDCHWCVPSPALRLSREACCVVVKYVSKLS
jgi:hypothetical protein